MRLSAAVLFSLVAFALPACAEQSGDESESTTDALRTESADDEELRPVVLFEEHDGSDIDVKEGQSVIVRLPENPSAGYRWKVASDGDLKAKKTYESNAPRTRIGAGGTAVFTWKTEGKAGEHEISLKYARGGGTPAKEFKARLRITNPEERECPSSSVVNCMPPYRTATKQKLCARDYIDWAEANCDVMFTH